MEKGDRRRVYQDPVEGWKVVEVEPVRHEQVEPGQI